MQHSSRNQRAHLGIPQQILIRVAFFEKNYWTTRPAQASKTYQKRIRKQQSTEYIQSVIKEIKLFKPALSDNTAPNTRVLLLQQQCRVDQIEKSIANLKSIRTLPADLRTVCYRPSHCVNAFSYLTPHLPLEYQKTQSVHSRTIISYITESTRIYHKGIRETKPECSEPNIEDEIRQYCRMGISTRHYL